MGNDLIQIGNAPLAGGVGVEVLSLADFASAPAAAGGGKTFYLETFGCQMNVHDSEKVAGVLVARGYRPVDSHQEADIILYNTCSIREKAAQKVFSRLGAFRKAPSADGKIIGVLGCVAQQEGERFFERAPQVSLVCGSASYAQLPDLLAQLESGNRRVTGLALDTEDCFETEFTRRDNRFRAYLTIIEGCDQRCAFCVVPMTRGPERSRSGAKIIAECRRLVDAGYTEIQILGQIVNAWRDPSPARWSFAELLSRVAEAPGVRRVRFTTSHPRYFTADIVQAIDSHPALCDQIHLPVQAGSTEVLARMLRGYSREEYLEKIHCIRKAQRAISLSTDMIVGFCGESEKDFEQTVSLLAEVEYDQVFSFKFSPRPNTAALGFVDTVAEEEKSRRLAVLQEAQRQIQLRRNQALVGQTFEVLVEGYQPRLGQAVGRTYYIGVRSDQRLQAVCVLPSGIEEGTTLSLPDREFAVLTNRPVSFTLYSSTTRHDAHGELAVVDEEQIHRHAPLVTLLRYGKKSRQIDLGVQLKASFTEVGTLELWCESLKTQHRWRLQFELRGDEGELQRAPLPPQSPPPIPEVSLDAAGKLIRTVFGKPRDAAENEAIGSDEIVSKLEESLGRNKDSWPVDAIRKLCDLLAGVVEGRAKSRRHEARWLNLFGFCLRPGFGALLDDWRVNQARRFYMAGLAFPHDLQCQVEWLVLWRRVAGGFNPGQQQELYHKYGSLLGVKGKKTGGRLNSQVEHEGWRLLASLEHLPVSARAALGEELIARIKKEPTDKAWLWSLGRLGARIPLFGPLNCVVSVETASKWLGFLLDLPEFTAETASAVVQLGSRTGDRFRDIEDGLRQRAITRLTAAGISEELRRSLDQYVPPTQADAMRIFGESLPEGLRILG